MIISRTPFRISFFGGGTDYPKWYRKHGGSVLVTTIDKYCYITCRYLPPFFEHRIRIVYTKSENCQTIDEISHPAVREILRYLKMDRGVEIHHDADLPARSGMGSSSSFTVGLLQALYALKGYMPSKKQLASESIFIEQDILQETVGSQDQVSTAYGGFNQITFSSDGDFSVRPMVFPSQRIKDLNAHLMLFFTGIKRTASNVASSYVNTIDDRKEELHKINEFLDQGLSILNSNADIVEFGELLHESWKVKRSFSSMVSNSYVDNIYEEALRAGAVGGKIIGAGGGGFMLLFVPPSRQECVRSKLQKLIHVPFTFESSGSQIIFYEPEQDYAILERKRDDNPVQRFKELGEEQE